MRLPVKTGDYGMKKGFMKQFVLFVMAMILSGIASGTFAAESIKEPVIRLLRYEGTVEIEDASGETRSVTENTSLRVGEALITGTDSKADVSVDDTRILTLDSETRVEFSGDADAFTLTLTDGALLLDVQEKLDDNETLNIQTGGMKIDIRGTILFVTEKSEGEGRTTRLGVLEGTAQIDYTDHSGASRVLPVPAGNIAAVTAPAPNEMNEAALRADNAAITPLAREDIPPFVERQMEADPALNERIDVIFGESASFPADGDWEWNGAVSLVAQSASKLYDGTPLTRPTDVLVYGLPAEFSVSANARGTQTDAGTSSNVIGKYTIYNPAEEDVTSHFTSISTVSGNLTVDPAPLVVWTGSAEKVYDGTPLTCPEAGIRSVSGYSTNGSLPRNLSYVSNDTPEGSVLYGLGGAVIVHGTNPLTGETREEDLRAGEKMQVYISDEGQSLRLETVAVKEDELPDDVLRIYADNPDLLSQSCAEAGWDKDVISERIRQLSADTGSKIAQDGLTVSAQDANSLIKDMTNVRINLDSDITSYNNRALTEEEADFTPVRITDTIKVTATGSRTEVGRSVNTYSIYWNNEKPGNYVLSEDLGFLTVTAPENETLDDFGDDPGNPPGNKLGNDSGGENPEHDESVTFTAPSAEKTYDGKPLTAQTATADGLPAGYTWKVTISGSQTSAGSSVNKITSYKILNASGEDVTSDFTDVTLKKGTLTVKKADLTIQTGSGEKVYDGTALTEPDSSVTGLAKGETIAVTASGSITDVGSADNSYTIDWGSTDPDNYNLQEEIGTLTIEPLQLNVSLGGGTFVYDGNARLPYITLTYLNGSHAGETIDVGQNWNKEENLVSSFSLFTGDTLSVQAGGYIWEAGTTAFEYAASFTSGNSSNYSISYSDTSVTITPREITVTTGSAEKPYDGSALTCAEAFITGLVEYDSDVTVTATGSQTEVGEGTNTYKIDWQWVDPSNYTINENLGKLKVTEAETPLTEEGTPEGVSLNGSAPEGRDTKTGAQMPDEEPIPEAVTEQAAPQEAASQETTPDEPAPQEAVPQEAAPQETTPQEAAPQEAAPQEAAPQEAAPQEAAPQEAAPQEDAPQEAAPQETAPQEAAPQETAPQEAVSQEAAPQEAKPQETAPQEAKPQEAAPQEAKPQQKAAEGNASKAAPEKKEEKTAGTPAPEKKGDKAADAPAPEKKENKK